MVRTELKTYETISGEEVKTKVLIIPGTVKSINKNIRKNSNDTEWRLCQAQILMPDESTRVVPAQLFETSYLMFPDSFIEGSEIELEVQTEGEGKGLAKMKLPSLGRIDVEAFMLDLLNEKQSGDTIKDNLVDEELVS